MSSDGNASFFLRPGVTDLGCVVLLLLNSLAGVKLEPAHRDFWLIAPSLLALPLLCAATLLFLPWKFTTTAACVIHVMILIGSVFGILLAAFLMVTILFFGTGLVVLVPCVVVAGNSLFTLNRIRLLAPGRRNSVQALSQ
jgi:hypothetical protein